MRTLIIQLKLKAMKMRKKIPHCLLSSEVFLYNLELET